MNILNKIKDNIRLLYEVNCNIILINSPTDIKILTSETINLSTSTKNNNKVAKHIDLKLYKNDMSFIFKNVESLSATRYVEKTYYYNEITIQVNLKRPLKEKDIFYLADNFLAIVNIPFDVYTKLYSN